MGTVANSQGLRWSLLSSTVWSRARNLEDGVSFVLFPGKHGGPRSMIIGCGWINGGFDMDGYEAFNVGGF